MKTYLVSGVRKLDFFTLYIAFIKLSLMDLAKFLLFLLILLTTLLLSILIYSRVFISYNIVFNIKINRSVILLKLEMKY